MPERSLPDRRGVNGCFAFACYVVAKPTDKPTIRAGKMMESAHPPRTPKVLFINPPSLPYQKVVRLLANEAIDIVQTVAWPTGILYLAAMLEREVPGVEIRIVDLALALSKRGPGAGREALSLATFVEEVIAEQVPADFVPDLVGISILFSTAHRSAGVIGEVAKKVWPASPIVVGGMHATNAVETLLAMPGIDYVCRGEAEAIIADLARVCRDGGDPEGVPGIIGEGKFAAAEAAGRSGVCELAPFVEDLDSLPFPAWHLLPANEYLFLEHSRNRKIDSDEQLGEATIITTRGCPFSCTFCSSWTVHGRKMRFRSIGNVLAELRILHDRYGARLITPEDDLFTAKKSRIVALCDAVADEFQGSLSFQFPNGLSVATLDRDVIRAMKRMGMTVANIAIESGSAYTQRHLIKKNCNLERAKQVVRDCREAGTYVRAYFIFGFPGETRELIDESIAYSANLETDWNTYVAAAPLVGTEMYRQLLDRGSIDHSYNWDNSFFQERSFDTPEIGAEELKELIFDTNIRVNFFGNYNLRVGNYERAIRLFKDILRSYPGQLAAQYCIGLCHRELGDEVEFDRAIAGCRRILYEERHPNAVQIFRRFPDSFPLLAPN
jgi:radical SAM superfamily enzyme YgiQ (UPF0313 family)